MTFSRRLRIAVSSIAAILLFAIPSSVATHAAVGATVDLSRVIGVSPGYGIYYDTDTELASELSAAKAAGATMVRLDLSWASAESAPGVYSWTMADRLVKAATSWQLQVLLVVGVIPDWARAANTSKYQPPNDYATFGRFLGAAAAHFGPLGVRTWEIFNEPNISQFWQPSPNAWQYTKLLKIAYTAIKQKQPTSTVLTGGLSPAYDSSDRMMIAPVTFVTQMYAAGARGFFDGLAMHPYSSPIAPTAGTPLSNAFLQLPSIQQVMQAQGDGAKLVWATEIGWSTCQTDQRCVTPAQQANYLATAIAAWRRGTSHGPLFVFGLRDRGSAYAQGWGFIGNAGAPKPGFSAILNAGP